MVYDMSLCAENQAKFGGHLGRFRILIGILLFHEFTLYIIILQQIILSFLDFDFNFDFIIYLTQK
jgi:hypothetical protein